MGKRKVFSKTDLSVPQVEHTIDGQGNVTISPDVLPPINTKVKFERNVTGCRSFDFSSWYGSRIDPITYACQRQIERFLAGQDAIVSTATVTAYCNHGLRLFLSYCELHATAIGRDLTLKDINRNLIEGYLLHLAGMPLKTSAQKSYYSHTKSVLIALGRREILAITSHGINSTFPRNAFPNSNRKVKGETALSKREREEFIAALRKDIQHIWTNDAPPSPEVLTSALLFIALYTGRNTTPLLEMSRNCLHAHPKDNTSYLVLWKRRGSDSSRVPLRNASSTEPSPDCMLSVKANVERLILRVMALTLPLNLEAPGDIKNRVWLYRSRAIATLGQITVLSPPVVQKAVGVFVSKYALKDSDGNPLRINISRLRKTFGNRIWELTNGDLVTTAAALGNSPRVTDQHYLAPSENARKNWRFMGEILVNELITATIGATFKTPLGNCSDPINGQFAPKREGATCTNFMNCLRCKHYVVTEADLFKLFSFYFRVLKERSRMDKHRWTREYSHIPRLIDQYIIAEGLRRGTFKVANVDAAREHARTKPHPFWSIDLIESLELLS